MGVGANVVRRVLTSASQRASKRLLCTPICVCLRGTEVVRYCSWPCTGYAAHHTDRQAMVSAENSDEPDGGAQASQVTRHESSLDNMDAHVANLVSVNMSEAESSGPGAIYAVLHAPVDAAIYILDGVHCVTGMPWWLTIMTSTVAFRAMLFPLTVKQLKKATQLAQLRSKLPSLLPPRGAGVSFAEQYILFTKKRQELGAPSPGWIIGVPLVQIPLLISWILAVRQMALAPHPGFDAGGSFWFVDLTSPVQGALGALFPTIVAWTYFINLQMSFRGVEERKGMGATIMKFYKWGLEALTIPTLLIAFHLPQGVFMYWVPNNMISLAQTVALQQPFIRQLVGLPPDLKVGGMPTIVSKCGSSSGEAQSVSDELLVLAASHAAQGQRDEAIHMLKQAVIKSPDLAEAFNALGKLHVEIHQWAAAVTFYQSAIAKARDDGLLIAAYLGAGIALYHQGKKKAAIEALRSVTMLEVPDEPHSRRRYLKAMVALGSVLHERGQKEEALQILRQAALYDSVIESVYVRKLEQDCREE